MDIHPVAFYAFAVLAIAFSLLVVIKRNPVASAFSLVLVFFSFAGIYAALDAHLVAALQVLVYAGAIMVLFVFVIMLLNADVPSLDFGRSSPALKAGAGIVAALLLGALIKIFHDSPVPAASGKYSPDAVARLGGNTQVASALMFSEYVLPFELVSILLLAGIVGAVAIAKRKRGDHAR